MIYGDNPQTINQQQDALGLTSYTHVPQITAVAQSGNLYVYCMSSPALYIDKAGKDAIALLNESWRLSSEVAILSVLIPLPYGVVIVIGIGLVGTIIAGGVLAHDSIKMANKAPPKPPAKLKNGDKVKTPETHPDEWTKNKDGSYTHNKTGWRAKKDKSNHGGPHWDMNPPRSSGHINVDPEGNIFGGSH